MGVEEWRIDWLPPPEEIAISLEGYAGGYPVLLEIFGPDGNRVYRQQFSQPPLTLPVRLLAAGQYRYEVKRDEKNIEAGMIEL